MLVNISLALLFFLPVIESFNRNLGLSLLFLSAALLGICSLKSLRLSFDRIDALWVILLSIFACSVIFSLSPFNSFLEFNRYLSYYIIFNYVRKSLNKDKLISEFLFPMILSNTVILTALYILYSLPFFNILMHFEGMNLFYPFYGHNRISDLLIFTIPLSIFYFQYQKHKKKKTVSLILSLLFILILVISQGRGAMLALSYAMLIYIVVKKISGNNPILKWITGITIITVTFLSLSFLYSNFLISPVYNGGSFRGFYKPAKEELRFEYFKQSIMGFLSSPLIGTGLDTFKLVSLKYQSQNGFSSGFTHNHFLEIFQETGIFGGVLFGVLILLILNRVIRIIRERKDIGQQVNIEEALFIGVLASIFHSLIDYDWHYISIFMIFWISTGLVINENPAVNKRYFILNRFFKIVGLTSLFTGLIFLIFFSNFYKVSDKLVYSGNIDKGIMLLEVYKKVNNGDVDVYRKLSEYYLLKSDFDRVHELNDRIIYLSPMISSKIIKDDMLLYIRQMEKALRNKRYKQLSVLLDRVSIKYPKYNLITGNTKISDKDYSYITDYLNRLKKKVMEDYFLHIRLPD